MSDRKQVSRKKKTASNSSNPSLAPNIPSLPSPKQNYGLELNQTTPRTVHLETSESIGQVTDEQENQDNIRFNESPLGDFNILEKASIFRPQEKVQRQEELEQEEDSELIQTKLNVSQVGGKQESASERLSRNFQLQLNEEDKLDKPIESFNYLEKASIFRPQQTYQLGSPREKELITHELTHLVQQNGGALQRAGDYSGLLPGHETYSDSYEFQNQTKTDFTYHHIIPENKLHLVIGKLKELLKGDDIEELSEKKTQLQNTAQEQWLSSRTKNTVYAINAEFSDFGVELSESQIKSILSGNRTIDPIFTEVEEIIKTQVTKKIKTDSAKKRDNLIKSFKKLFNQDKIMIKWSNDEIQKDVKTIVENNQIRIFFNPFFQEDPIKDIIANHKPKENKKNKSTEPPTPNKGAVIKEIEKYCKNNIEEFYQRACKLITENSFYVSGSRTLKAYLRDTALPREDQDELEDAVAWNPGNIHRGPKSDLRPNPKTPGFDELLDDGGEEFEKAAQNLVTKEHYQTLEKLNTNIDNFLGNYNNNNLQMKIQAATTIVEQMLDIQQQGLTKFNQEQWEEVNLNNEQKMRVKEKSK